MIIQDNELLLRVDCKDVDPREVNALIIVLENELKKSALQGSPGIGLAAPQIGIQKKAAIVRIDNIKYNLINCKISKKEDPFIFKNEGCLSFPGKTADTLRYNRISVIDNMVEPKEFVVTGLTAVCVQHEIEHWHKKLFFDSKR
jgi:peptide deformylase